MLSSARSLSKQVLSHRQQIQQQTKTQLRNQHTNQHTAPARPKEQQQQQQQQTQQQQQFHDDDLHKSAMLDKMRLENRERKKRWREVNGERNKDNDLRCRVNKRANQLYGLHASEAKERWIGEEFERRQQRRREKEGRKRMQSPDAEEDGARTPVPTAAAEDALLAAPEEDRAAKCPRRDGSRDAASASSSASASASAGRIPLGFGSYAAMPAHQVRAAYDFWRSAAEHHALETAAMAGVAAAAPPSESQFVRAHGNNTGANEVTGHAHRHHQHGQLLRLPPLSSIVPENYLSQQQQQLRIHDADNAAVQTPLANAHAAAADAAELPLMQSSNPSAHVPPPPQPSLLLASKADANASLNYRSYHPGHAPRLSAAAAAAAAVDAGASPSLLHMSIDSTVPNPQAHHRQPSSSFASLADRRRRHLRPWEDDSAVDDDDALAFFTAAPPAPLPPHSMHRRGSSVASSTLLPSPASPVQLDHRDLNGLSEAAFSLMSLSSSASSSSPSSASASAAMLQQNQYQQHHLLQH
ncbi:hypothetical protein LPJ53_004757 [Coemansia erecta]|uniref:DUF3020 domain-containing protein n=1 Tax=Coemansia erecta TaxID=147472 RepID=A0A9W8CQZ9_9FUNG|nr:hypothetical protein LPJ53_004757 [Coemansia erecta]